MFFKAKEISVPSRIPTIIGKECSFQGNLESSSGEIRIDGYFEGNIHSEGDLVVGETGNVTGKISARNILVAGEVHGSLETHGKLELGQTAKVLGDLKMKILVINDGAFFQGECIPESRGALQEIG